eukprot:2535224-Rhodomonas_salina.1
MLACSSSARGAWALQHARVTPKLYTKDLHTLVRSGVSVTIALFLQECDCGCSPPLTRIGLL